MLQVLAMSLLLLLSFLILISSSCMSRGGSSPLPDCLHPAPVSPMAPGPEWWVNGKQGALPPIEQAKVWALHTLATKFFVNLSNADIAGLVYKVPVSGGQRQHPSRQAIATLRGHMDADGDSWYPDKRTEHAKKRGPKSQFTPQKRRCVANAAMTLKESGVEPTVTDVVARCPQATLNSRTQAPFTDKYILQVFRTICHDGDSSDTWGHMEPLHKTALSVAMKQWRARWAAGLLRQGRSAGWYCRHCVWIDPCSTIVYASTKAAFDENQSRPGKGKRWMSKGSRKSSRNLRASPYAGKQARAGDKRLWRFVILARGRLHVEFMDSSWAQTGEGMAQLVKRLPNILRTMLGHGAMLPRVVVSDRGPGFYVSGLRNGQIVPAYRAALAKAGMRPFAGEIAAYQPPDCPDVLLHETSVGWIRKYFKKHPFTRAADLYANVERMRAVMAQCLQHINTNNDVLKLCNAWPKRLQELVDNEGERLKY